MDIAPIIKEITAQETWPIRHQVMWPNESFDYIKLPNDELGLHFGLYVENKLVSVISLFIIRNFGQFRKFATVAEAQGKGYGSQLLHYLMATANDRSIKKIWCNARVTKTAYYAKFGMQTTTTQFTKNGIDYVVMERVLELGT